MENKHQMAFIHKTIENAKLVKEVIKIQTETIDLLNFKIKQLEFRIKKLEKEHTNIIISNN